MSVRDLLPSNKNSVSVSRGSNPIVSFQDEMNQLFNNFFGEVSLPKWMHHEQNLLAVSPAIDVVENEKEFKITAEIPGIDVKDVHITASDGYLTIKGEKKEEKEEKKEEHKGYYRRERSYGSFQRVVALPDTSDTDKVEATYKNGLLNLTIPKKAGAKSKERKIEIKQVA